MMPFRKWFGWKTIYGVDGEHATPYLTTVWVGRLRLHTFHRGDADPDCHDHPWDFWTFPLTSYVEEVAEPVWMSGPLPMQYHRHTRVVHAWRLHYRPATHCHRVLGRATKISRKLPPEWRGDISAPWHTYDHLTDGKKIVTIVWRGRQGRPWGFLRNRNGQWCWTPWKEYVFGGGKHAPCELEGGDT